MGNFLEQLKLLTRKWAALTPNQRVYAAVGASVAIAMVFFTVLLTGGENYEILYTDLEPEQSAGISGKLGEMGIPFKTNQQGKTILVPSGRKQAVIVALASEGFPRRVKNGYLDLDTAQWGQTELMQKISIIRAQEGELENTLSKLFEIDQARVHLAIPEKTLFKEEERAATAAVFLKLHTGVSLGRERVEAVKYMISSSVEGLEPGYITITDSNGNLLARGGMENTEGFQSEERLATRRGIEKYLEEKALSIIGDVIGWEKARVKVAVELDYELVDKTIESYDPDKVAVRSEERREETGGSEGAETSITNYEINRTVEHIVEESGNVLSISAAILVDGTYAVNGEGVAVYTPRPAQEIDKLASLAKNAIGYNEDRGDTFEMVNLPFDTSGVDRALTEVTTTETLEYIRNMAVRVLILILILGIFFMVKKKIQLVSEDLDSEEPLPPLEEVDDERKEKLARLLPLSGMHSEEDEQLQLMQEEIQKFTREEPETTAGFIRSWLAED